MPITDIPFALEGLTFTGISALVIAIVIAIRRYRSGSILDGDAVIARLDKRNEKLSARNEELERLVEVERSKRWHLEDMVAELLRNNKPEQVDKDAHKQ